VTTANMLSTDRCAEDIGPDSLAKDENLGRNERLILEQLIQSGRAMKAYDILEPLTGKGIRAPMTVYRALDRLTAKGLVKRISTINAYQYIPARDIEKCTAFLVCRNCQATQVVTLDCDALNQLIGQSCIRDQDMSIELMTECQDCSGTCDGNP